MANNYEGTEEIKATKVHCRRITLLLLFTVANLLTMEVPAFEFAGVGVSSGQASTAEPGPFGSIGEYNTNAATFIVARTDTNGDLTVFLSRGGTATASIHDWVNPCTLPQWDYLLVGGDYWIPPCEPSGTLFPAENVTIPAGQSNVVVSVLPAFDYYCEPTETVTMFVAGYNSSITGTNGYAIFTNVATIDILNTETLGSGLGAAPNLIQAGDSTTLACVRQCGCDTNKALFSFPVTNRFYLLGTANYGVDYSISTVPGVELLDGVPGQFPTSISVILSVSNREADFMLTSFSNNIGGDKTVIFLPQDYFPGCSNSLVYYFTNAWGCVFPNAPFASILTIQQAEVPPTLTSPRYENQTFSFDIYGMSGASYPISVSTDLFYWTVVSNVTMTSSVMGFTDYLAGDFGQRYYRIGNSSAPPASASMSLNTATIPISAQNLPLLPLPRRIRTLSPKQQLEQELLLELIDPKNWSNSSNIAPLLRAVDRGQAP